MLLAELDELLEPSAERVVPRCPVFARCGGCHYQHADAAFQLERKREILREGLQRIGKLDPPEEIRLISGPAWGYRNRIQLQVQGRRLGFHESGSHRLCPVTECVIASPRLNEALAALRKMTGERRFPRFLRTVELFTNENEIQVNTTEAGTQRVARSFFDWCADRIPGAVSSALEYGAAGEVFRVSPRSFFQVNRCLIDQFVEEALGDAAGESAVDLYAGVGLFSLPLARRFRSVQAVESSLSAVRDLEFNAQRAGLPVSIHRMAAAGFLEGLTQAPDFILADPPRAGLGTQTAAQLIRLSPARLALVSCDPATLARDLAALLGAGYRMEKLTLIDLFPQTFHIESVARLSR